MVPQCDLLVEATPELTPPLSAEGPVASCSFSVDKTGSLLPSYWLPAMWRGSMGGGKDAHLQAEVAISHRKHHLEPVTV